MLFHRGPISIEIDLEMIRKLLWRKTCRRQYLGPEEPPRNPNFSLSQEMAESVIDQYVTMFGPDPEHEDVNVGHLSVVRDYLTGDGFCKDCGGWTGAPHCGEKAGQFFKYGSDDMPRDIWKSENPFECLVCRGQAAGIMLIPAATRPTKIGLANGDRPVFVQWSGPLCKICEPRVVPHVLPKVRVAVEWGAATLFGTDWRVMADGLSALFDDSDDPEVQDIRDQLEHAEARRRMSAALILADIEAALQAAEHKLAGAEAKLADSEHNLAGAEAQVVESEAQLEAASSRCAAAEEACNNAGN